MYLFTWYLGCSRELDGLLSSLLLFEGVNFLNGGLEGLLLLLGLILVHGS